MHKIEKFVQNGVKPNSNRKTGSLRNGLASMVDLFQLRKLKPLMPHVIANRSS